MSDKFRIEAKVTRTFEDTIVLEVEADDEEEATHKSLEVIQLYPDQHTVEGVPFVYTDSRTQVTNFINDMSMRKL